MSQPDPELTAAMLASRMRWSWRTAHRRLVRLASEGKARPVKGARGIGYVARASVLADEVPGFTEPNALERTVSSLVERVAELERRMDLMVKRVA